MARVGHADAEVPGAPVRVADVRRAPMGDWRVLGSGVDRHHRDPMGSADEPGHEHDRRRGGYPDLLCVSERAQPQPAL